MIQKVEIEVNLLTKLVDAFEASEKERLADHNMGLFPEQIEMVDKVREIIKVSDSRINESSGQLK